MEAAGTEERKHDEVPETMGRLDLTHTRKAAAGGTNVMQVLRVIRDRHARLERDSWVDVKAELQHLPGCSAIAAMQWDRLVVVSGDGERVRMSRAADFWRQKFDMDKAKLEFGEALRSLHRSTTASELTDFDLAEGTLVRTPAGIRLGDTWFSSTDNPLGGYGLASVSGAGGAVSVYAWRPDLELLADYDTRFVESQRSPDQLDAYTESLETEAQDEDVPERETRDAVKSIAAALRAHGMADVVGDAEIDGLEFWEVQDLFVALSIDQVWFSPRTMLEYLREAHFVFHPWVESEEVRALYSQEEVNESVLSGARRKHGGAPGRPAEAYPGGTAWKNGRAFVSRLMGGGYRWVRA